jgi:hypothetical protein
VSSEFASAVRRQLTLLRRLNGFSIHPSAFELRNPLCATGL